jgi:uncharacterized repeat protein (TIGR02543 family)
LIVKKHIYLPLVISLVFVLSLLGAAGCPTTDQYNLTTNVSPTGGGSVSPSDGSYDPGVTVTITANANSGYAFDYWSGSASGTNPTTTVVMDEHKSITAHFTPIVQTYTLTTSVSPSGAGSVSPSGGEFDAGTEVSLSATANSGYVFDYWSDDSNATGPNIKITMDSDMNLVANFAAVSGPEVLFSDDFSNPNSGWLTYDGYDGRADYQSGYFYIKDDTDPPEAIFTCAPGSFTDFTLEVETWLVGGNDDNWHLVSCRGQDDFNYYDFGVSADGYYDIVKFVDGDRITLVEPTYSSYINQGQGAVNLIHIECIGTSLSLSVNGHLLDTVTDSTFSSGEICLAANALGGSYTEVAFDNLVVTGEATGPATLFSDGFSHDTGDWDVYSDANGDVFYEGGWLHVMNYTTAPEDTETLLDGYFSNFVLEVDTKLVDGTDNNWHGVICRFQDEGNYYVFNVSADGYYYISRFIDFEQTALADATYSSYINQGVGAVNTMHIECVGSSFRFSANWHLLATVNDSTFSGGQIGFLATSWEGDFSEIAFDNLVVTEP